MPSPVLFWTYLYSMAEVSAAPNTDLALRECVGAPFADAARVEIVESPPAAPSVRRVVWPPRARAEPFVPVDLLFRRHWFGRQPVVSHLSRIPRGDVRPDGMDLAEPAGAEHLVAEGEIALAEPLRPRLVNAPVASGGFDDGPALGHGHGRRLLGIDVLARSHRQHGGGGVPSVAGGNQHPVDVGARGEKFPYVTVHCAVVVAVASVDDLLDRLAALFPGVADSDKLHVLFREHPVQIVGAAVAYAYSAHDDAFAGRNLSVPAEDGCRDYVGHGRQSRRASEKQAACEVCLFILHVNLLNCSASLAN